MTTHTRIPLPLTVSSDLTQGYRLAEEDYGLERAGSIKIDLTTDEKEFQIVLNDRIFRNQRRPLHPPSAATINLNKDALFDLVQLCRGQWEEALDSEYELKPGADGRKVKDYLFEKAWRRPVDASKFRALAAKLAVAGANLFECVFESNRFTQLDGVAAKLREVARTGERALTVNAPDFHLPWRMLYTHPHPNEPLAPDGSNFSPRGFWGYQHIIEEFTSKYYPLNYHLEGKNGQLGFGAVVHENIDAKFNVECLKVHRDFIDLCLNKEDRLVYDEWTKKADVMDALSVDPFPQQVVYFLCHAEGAGTTEKPSLCAPVLQLSDGTINAAELRKCTKHRFGGHGPLVFINACRGGHLGTKISHNFTFASELVEQGAVCLIGPQIEIPAVFAGEFGRRFFERLLAMEMPPPMVGIILRDITRFMWEEHNPLGLVYSLYAGADCHIRWRKDEG